MVISSNANVWVVITSINGPKERYYDYLDFGWNVVIVGDQKSNESLFEKESRYKFLSYDEQAAMYPNLSKLIGANTYARKNIGYLYALSQGASYIWETDDDTFLRSELLNPIDEIQTFECSIVTGDYPYFNPYNFFAPGKGLWPRGYPMRAIAQDREFIPSNQNIEMSNFKLLECDVIQTLVNLEPDVDAIYRMTVNSRKQDFPIDRKIIKVKKGIFTPGNTQSTLWLNKDKMDYLYIPSTVSFRFCDILKMYIAQTRCTLAYTGFLSEQFRNEHDYLSDFNLELSCYLDSERCIEILSKAHGLDILSIYGILVLERICDQRELDSLDEFVRLLDEIRHESI
jgi:hypothetical protein